MDSSVLISPENLAGPGHDLLGETFSPEGPSPDS